MVSVYIYVQSKHGMHLKVESLLKNTLGSWTLQMLNLSVVLYNVL